MGNIEKSQFFGALQSVVDDLYAADEAPYMEIVDESQAFKVSRMDVIQAAEQADLPEDLIDVVNLLPPGDYTRHRLTTQLNSAITGHAWGQVYGTLS